MEAAPFIDFGGKRVLVTGATSGIGEAIAGELVSRRAQPILAGRNGEKLEELLRRFGLPREFGLVLDLENMSAIAPAVQGVAKKVGRIFGCCHSAGIAATRPLSSTSVDSIRRMLDINLVSGIELARAVCRRDVMEPEGGSMVFISSVYALVGMPGEIDYSASKGALIAAARSMAIELARRGVRVNTVSPGFVTTHMTDKAFKRISEEHRQQIIDAHPLGAGSPADVARAVVFLLAPQNRWITGANLVVDGGFSSR